MNIAKIYLTAFICFMSFIFFHSVSVKAEEAFVETVKETDVYKKQGDTFIRIGILKANEQLKVLSSLDEEYYTIQYVSFVCTFQCLKVPCSALLKIFRAP
jgi:hypothetical protein